MPQHHDPDEIQRLFAQQDATAFRPPTGTEANTLLGIAETVVDFTPIVGDIKALTFDAPRSFAGGHPILGSIDVLSAVPLLGLPFDLIRKGIRATGRGFMRATQPLANLVGRNVDNVTSLRIMDRTLTKVMGEKRTLSELNDIIDTTTDEIALKNLIRSDQGKRPLSVLEEEFIGADVLGEPLTQLDISEAINQDFIKNNPLVLKARRATKEVRRALDEGRPDDARRLMQQLIERDRAPLDPTR